MNTTCLRCSTALDTDVVNCPTCGADRKVELAVAAELNPAIAALQKLLALMGVLSICLGLIIYDHLEGRVPDSVLWSTAGPSLIGGAIMLFLCALARRAPLPIALLSFGLFALGWIMQVVENPGAAITPSWELGLRVFFAMILGIAVKAAFKARRIRTEANARFPDARVIRS